MREGRREKGGGRGFTLHLLTSAEGNSICIAVRRTEKGNGEMRNRRQAKEKSWAKKGSIASVRKLESTTRAHLAHAQVRRVRYMEDIRLIPVELIKSHADSTHNTCRDRKG